MGVYPITIILIVAVAIASIFLIRYGVRQDRIARNVPAKPGATSVLAIISLVVAFLVPPVGVLLGHITLYRIGQGRATGRKIADAALAVGYALLLVELVFFLILYPGLRWFAA